MELSRYLDLFLEEAREHLRAAEELREGLEQDPADPAGWRDLLRHAHSLKGMAAAMGYPAMVACAHRLEDRLELLVEPSDRGDAAQLPELFDGFDQLARIVLRIERGELEAVVPQRQAPRASGRTPGRWRVEIDLDARTGASARATVAVVTGVTALGRVVEARPPLLAPTTGRFAERLGLVLDSDRTEVELRRELSRLPGGVAATLEVDETPPRASFAPAAAGRLIRVASARLDALQEELLELRLQQRRVEAALGPGSEPLRRKLERSGTILRSAFAAVTEMRLVPFESVSRRLERAVADLAGELGKEVAFAITGADVRLERSVLEALVDPLLHVLRNALDHGIESPAERRRAGKPRSGSLVIRLERLGDRNELAIEDDGRGIDPARLKSTAIDLGLIDHAAAERLTDPEVLLLTTLPGLSTAPRLSHVSGRGLGLDVARDVLARLGGRIEIRSRPGYGTTVAMSVPPSVALIRTLLVRSAGACYAIPIEAVRRTAHFAPPDAECGEPPDRLRLDLRLGTRDANGPVPAGSWTVCVEAARRRIDLLVDGLAGRQDLLVRPLGSPLTALPVYSGAALLSDGTIALVLDPAHLSGSVFPPCAGSAPSAPHPPAGRPPSRS